VVVGDGAGGVESVTGVGVGAGLGAEGVGGGVTGIGVGAGLGAEGVVEIPALETVMAALRAFSV